MKHSKLLILYIVLLIGVILAMTVIFRWVKSNEIISHRDYNEIISSRTMNVVTDYNSIGYYIQGDSVVGFQYELLKELKKEWGININIFLENNLEENLTGLEKGNYDIIARNIPVNSELKSRFSFIEPITLNKEVLVQRKAEFNDSILPLRNHLDLAGQTIHVTKDSPSKLRLANLSHEIGDTIYVVEDDVYGTEQLVMMVAAGDIDYAVCDEKVAKLFANRIPEIDIETDISFTQLESWALRKDSSQLLDSLNAWFLRFRKSDRFSEIYNRYY